MKLKNVTVVVLWMTAVVSGTTASVAEEKLPTGEKIMDQFVRSTGGKAAYKRIKNRIVKGKLTMSAMGMSMDFEEYAAAPGSFRSKMRAEMMGGVIERGITDGIAWEVNPMGGARLVEGDMGDVMKRSAYFHKEVDWRGLYTEAKCVELAEFESMPCYKVILKDKGGKETIAYFEKGTWLLRGEEITLQGPMGSMTIISKNKSYKEVDGILIPHTIAQTVQQGAMKREVVITIDTVEHNVDMPADQFVPPEKVVELLKAQKEKGEQESKPDEE